MSISINRMLFGLIALASAHTAFAQSTVGVDLDGSAGATAEDHMAAEAMAKCIIEERKGLAKRYLKKRGDDRLRLLLPLISAPCQPANGSSLNVPLLESKLRELLDA